MRRLTRGAGVLLAAGLFLGACSSDSGSDDASTDGTVAPDTTVETTLPAEPIQILVTNDDGVGSEGIAALVTGLEGVEGVEVTVVAPATNQSGKGSTTTDGELQATEATTADGYEAWAVEGTPADTIVWAIDDAGIDVTPDLVISGINAGQNMGPLVEVSGTVGAARTAAQRGIPALAASMGGLEEPHDWDSGVGYVLDWLEANLSAIEAGTLPTDVIANLNIPTCPTGAPRGEIEVPLAASADGYADPVDCDSTAADPADDIAAFLVGFVPLSEVSATPAPTD